MKKYFSNIRTLAALLMAGAAFAACSNDDNNMDNPANPAGEKVYTLTVNATKDGGAQTRSLSFDGDNLVAKWETTDQIAVIKLPSSYLGILTPTNISTDGQTATFTGTFTNEYGPTPAEATPEYEKYLTGDIPSQNVTFEFKLEKASDNTGNFDYVKIGDDPFTTQTEEITLGPSLTNDSGVFDTITFLAEGTYKFKITETPNTNGALDSRFVYDPREYEYTVVVTGVGTALQASDSYKYVDDDEVEQTATKATFSNKYTPNEVAYRIPVTKRVTGDKTVEDKQFDFTLTAKADNPEGAILPTDRTASIIVPAGETGEGIWDYFDSIVFKKEGTYTFYVNEKEGDDPNIGYDDGTTTFELVIKDNGGELEIKELNTAQTRGIDDMKKAREVMNEGRCR